VKSQKQRREGSAAKPVRLVVLLAAGLLAGFLATAVALAVLIAAFSRSPAGAAKPNQVNLKADALRVRLLRSCWEQRVWVGGALRAPRRRSLLRCAARSLPRRPPA